LVEHADVVVSSLELHRQSSREVVAALRHLHPDKPVVMQASEEVLARWAPLFEGHWGPVPVPTNKRTLLESLDFALATPTGGAPDRTDAQVLPDAIHIPNSRPRA
jgi:hypothetical protein